MRSSKYNSPAYVTRVKYLRSVLYNPEINYAVVTRTCQWILSWPSWIQCTSCLFQATSIFFCRMGLFDLFAGPNFTSYPCMLHVHVSHFPGFIILIILVKVGYELRILLRNLFLHWGLKGNNSLWRVIILPLGSPVVGSAPFRPNGRRRLGIALKRLFDEAKTDLSRPNSWRMMMMMMTEKFEVSEELLRITQKSSRTAWPVCWRHQRSFEMSSTIRSTTRRHIPEHLYLYEASDCEIILIL